MSCGVITVHWPHIQLSYPCPACIAVSDHEISLMRFEVVRQGVDGCGGA
jgi:hypothetical protein